MNSRVVKDKIFILRRHRYGEADLIIHGLNSQGARVALFARAALKSRKRFGGGVLEPTHYVQVMYQNRGTGSESSLHPLSEATLIDGFPRLRTDFARLGASLHFVQLIADVSREGDSDAVDLFNLLGNGLRAAEVSGNLEKLRIHFEVRLLSNQGILPHQPEEEMLLRVPVSEHETVPMDERAWREVEARTCRLLRDYLDKH